MDIYLYEIGLVHLHITAQRHTNEGKPSIFRDCRFKAKQNGKEFRVNIHKRAYLNPEKFPGDPLTHRYLSYIYVHVHAIKEDSMVVAIFRHYWSPLEKEFYINIEENTQILNVNYMIFFS